MTQEQKTDKTQPESLRIGKGVEIRAGQTVPVLQHSGCAGIWGKIIEINPQERTYKTLCNDCGKDVFMDTKLLSSYKPFF